jgi:hypothetical protein
MVGLCQSLDCMQSGSQLSCLHAKVFVGCVIAKVYLSSRSVHHVLNSK